MDTQTNYQVVEFNGDTLLEVKGEFLKAVDASGMSKAGKEFKKLLVYVATNGNSHEFEFFGTDFPADALECKFGEEVFVRFQPIQREYQGRYFTRLSGRAFWRVNPPTPPEAEEEAIPF